MQATLPYCTLTCQLSCTCVFCNTFNQFNLPRSEAKSYEDQVELLALGIQCDDVSGAPDSPQISTDNKDLTFTVAAGKDVVAVRCTMLRVFIGLSKHA